MDTLPLEIISKIIGYNDWREVIKLGIVNKKFSEGSNINYLNYKNSTHGPSICLILNDLIKLRDDNKLSLRGNETFEIERPKEIEFVHLKRIGNKVDDSLLRLISKIPFDTIEFWMDSALEERIPNLILPLIAKRCKYYRGNMFHPILCKIFPKLIEFKLLIPFPIYYPTEVKFGSIKRLDLSSVRIGHDYLGCEHIYDLDFRDVSNIIFNMSSLKKLILGNQILLYRNYDFTEVPILFPPLNIDSYPFDDLIERINKVRNKDLVVVVYKTPRSLILRTPSNINIPSPCCYSKQWKYIQFVVMVNPECPYCRKCIQSFPNYIKKKMEV